MPKNKTKSLDEKNLNVIGILVAKFKDGKFRVLGHSRQIKTLNKIAKEFEDRIEETQMLLLNRDTGELNILNSHA